MLFGPLTNVRIFPCYVVLSRQDHYDEPIPRQRLYEASEVGYSLFHNYSESENTLESTVRGISLRV